MEPLLSGLAFGLMLILFPIVTFCIGLFLGLGAKREISNYVTKAEIEKLHEEIDQLRRSIKK